MQPPVEVPPGSPMPVHAKSKNNVALIVVLTSCGCAFLMIPILAAILFPVFAQARAKARATTCLSNVKQMQLSVLMYVQDNDETFPAAKEWMTKSQPYILSPAAYHCPIVSSAPNGYSGMDGDNNMPFGYACSAYIDETALADFKTPENTILIYDSSTLTPNAFDELVSLPSPPRHQDRNVIGFLDGHCKTMTSDAFGALLASTPQTPSRPEPEAASKKPAPEDEK